jgi:hypothetical protein
MSTLPLEEKRNKLILALYELHTTKGPRVNIYELERLSGLERQEFYDMVRQLGRTQKGWLIKSNERVSITSEGIEKAEELLKMQMVEKERLVLQKIYDLGGPTHTDWVPIDRLSKELGMPFRELNSILLDFERKKGWTEGPDEAVGLTPAGVREVENPGGDARGGGTTVQNIFHGPFQGGMIIGGHGHTQHNTFSNNPKVGEAIDAVMRLVQQSDLGVLDKEDVLKDVERLKELTSKEPAPDTLQRIGKRIGMVKDGIEAAEKGGELLIKVTPYLVTLWQLLTTIGS